MTLLYVFPHPDDESFGPGPAIARQVREGHAVHLLTLTRGGATKVRHRLGLSIEEMGAVREEEMRCVEQTLGLASLTVLDLPDNGLRHLDPREIEAAVAAHVERLRPAVLVSYAVHGISGYYDHLVMHAVAKRVFCEMRDEGADCLKRLALFTLINGEIEEAPVPLKGIPREEVGAVVTYTDEDLAKARAALACYTTYAEAIAAHDPLRQVKGGVPFELFGERHAPPLDDLTAGL
ncbi:MAG TPA: PIG-L family deacetylase [Rubricoccaceae bacterium]|nr:PIG-L family deacetylase [Rubricoccaceae bacterium]